MCQQERSKLVTPLCQHCQKPVPKIAAQKRAKFCDRACFAEYRARPRFCVDCGKQTSQGAASRCWDCLMRHRMASRTGTRAPCRQCGEPLYRAPSGVAASSRKYGMFCDHKCFGLFYRGDHNPNYVAGKTVKDGYTKGFKTAKRAVLTRDNHSCQICGATPSRPEVHHKDGARNNHALDNLITLCGKCHKLAHKQLLK